MPATRARLRTAPILGIAIAIALTLVVMSLVVFGRMPRSSAMATPGAPQSTTKPAPSSLTMATPSNVMLTVSSPTWSRTPSTPSPTGPETTRTVTVTVTASDPAATTTTTAPSYPDVHVGAGGRECLRSGTGPYAAAAVESSATTCGFASSVWVGYSSAHLNGGSGSFTVGGSGRPITVNCSGDQPVRCRSTSDRVLIYGGRLIVG